MTSFSERLKELMQDTSVSQFARKVELSEALIRKYMKGSDPSLSKANQIAMKANCSLEWLATGHGYQYRKAEVVDMTALEHAFTLAQEATEQQDLSLSKHQQMKLVVASYQYLRSIKQSDGYFDLDQARNFIGYMTGLCQ